MNNILQDSSNWHYGDRVRIIGDRPTGGREGIIVGGFENTALVKLDKRYKNRRVYDYHFTEFEILDNKVIKLQLQPINFAFGINPII